MKTTTAPMKTLMKRRISRLVGGAAAATTTLVTTVAGRGGAITPTTTATTATTTPFCGDQQSADQLSSSSGSSNREEHPSVASGSGLSAKRRSTLPPSPPAPPLLPPPTPPPMPMTLSEVLHLVDGLLAAVADDHQGGKSGLEGVVVCRERFEKARQTVEKHLRAAAAAAASTDSSSLTDRIPTDPLEAFEALARIVDATGPAYGRPRALREMHQATGSLLLCASIALSAGAQWTGPLRSSSSRSAAASPPRGSMGTAERFRRNASDRLADMWRIAEKHIFPNIEGTVFVDVYRRRTEKFSEVLLHRVPFLTPFLNLLAVDDGSQRRRPLEQLVTEGAKYLELFFQAGAGCICGPISEAHERCRELLLQTEESFHRKGIEILTGDNSDAKMIGIETIAGGNPSPRISAALQFYEKAAWAAALKVAPRAVSQQLDPPKQLLSEVGEEMRDFKFSSDRWSSLYESQTTAAGILDRLGQCLSSSAAYSPNHVAVLFQHIGALDMVVGRRLLGAKLGQVVRKDAPFSQFYLEVAKLISQIYQKNKILEPDAMERVHQHVDVYGTRHATEGKDASAALALLRCCAASDPRRCPSSSRSLARATSTTTTTTTASRR